MNSDKFRYYWIRARYYLFKLYRLPKIIVSFPTIFMFLTASVITIAIYIKLGDGNNGKLITITAFYASIIFLKEMVETPIPIIKNNELRQLEPFHRKIIRSTRQFANLIPFIKLSLNRVPKYINGAPDYSPNYTGRGADPVGINCILMVENRGKKKLKFKYHYALYDSEGNALDVKRKGSDLVPPSPKRSKNINDTTSEEAVIPESSEYIEIEPHDLESIYIPLGIIDKTNIGDCYFLEISIPIIGLPLFTERRILKIEITEELFEKILAENNG